MCDKLQETMDLFFGEYPMVNGEQAITLELEERREIEALLDAEGERKNEMLRRYESISDQQDDW